MRAQWSQHTFSCSRNFCSVFVYKLFKLVNAAFARPGLEAAAAEHCQLTRTNWTNTLLWSAVMVGGSVDGARLAIAAYGPRTIARQAQDK